MKPTIAQVSSVDNAKVLEEGIGWWRVELRAAERRRGLGLARLGLTWCSRALCHVLGHELELLPVSQALLTEGDAFLAGRPSFVAAQTAATAIVARIRQGHRRHRLDQTEAADAGATRVGEKAKMRGKKKEKKRKKRNLMLRNTIERRGWEGEERARSSELPFCASKATLGELYPCL